MRTPRVRVGIFGIAIISKEYGSALETRATTQP